jgi:hypothetical protein
VQECSSRVDAKDTASEPRSEAVSIHAVQLLIGHGTSRRATACWIELGAEVSDPEGVVGGL